MAMDFLCQEMRVRDRCVRSVGKSLSKKVGSVGSMGEPTVTASVSLSLTVDGLLEKGEGCGERK